MPIRQLAPDVAAKIAAGEVVERPASVVKELIENSIDAGATQIRVDLLHGGLQLIRITDNGSGISLEELPLALARHATSKVAQIDDLEQIRSLGFRGEALASIAAVAEVTLVSRQRGAEQGGQIGALSGQVTEVTRAASPEGTTITVRNLFSAVPARLKFLKSRTTEISHCHHLLEQYALAYPEIRFNVFSEGKQIFSTPGDGQLSSVLVAVYGLQIAEQMVPLSPGDRTEDSDAPIVTGYTSRPTCYKSTRQHISFFVNRRWVLSRMLTTAVEGAYHSLLLTGRHPIAVINIDMDPSLLDVNVHPAKTEIRFLKERRVFAAVLRAVRAALLEEPEMPEWKPKQAPRATAHRALPEAAIAPEAASDEDDPLIAALQEETDDEAEEDTTSEEASPKRSRAIPMDNPWVTVSEEETGSKPPLSGRLWQSHVRRPETKTETPGPGPARLNPPPTSETSSLTRSRQLDASETRSRQGDAHETRSRQSDADETRYVQPEEQPGEQAILSRQQPEQQLSWEREVVALSPGVQEPQEEILSGQSIDPHQQRRLPKLRVIGQLSQSYIVTEGENGMYLIDQHAAHERILLERMVASMKARTPMSQLLLTPLRLELAPGELEMIEEHKEQLEQIGFHFQLAEDSSLEIKAVPGILVKQMNAHSLQELMVELTAEEQLGHTETWEERALANVACKAAIKANYFLTVSEMREMLEQLEQTKAPFSCCHGRPTMVHFGLTSLAREFERR
ncbi:DNA mismatch repair endonuclease MutL [Tengunoibacter tsumagoiensis]|uniref:DNA mismatch repair protein MutL n=1 Tax=Tengunoibacter tsumagoiensis TaxID=2014871 RepID=A0A401ZTZ1_9CHLR|nr:DNA mismatch repair endonuclease MutL [Tengunoibacter tsumagoiensis]GCE10317.1 DNA mismatch repair protein MutL [Tengunoibacter tsumagoiensis]